MFLAIVFAALAKFYWTPGFRLYTMGDGAPHFVNTWTVFRAFQEGEIPFWNNYWGCGSPFLQFYPPLFFYAAAALLFLHEDLLFAIRTLLFLLHILSGFTLYRLVRALGSPRSGGALAATAYVLAPWHVFQLFHFNRFPVAPVYVFLPVLFLSCEKAGQKPLLGWVVEAPTPWDAAACEVILMVVHNVRNKLNLCPECGTFHWEKGHHVCRDCRRKKERRKKAQRPKTPEARFRNNLSQDKRRGKLTEEQVERLKAILKKQGVEAAKAERQKILGEHR